MAHRFLISVVGAILREGRWIAGLKTPGLCRALCEHGSERRKSIRPFRGQLVHAGGEQRIDEPAVQP